MKASEKASVAFGKAPRRIIFTFCNLQKTIVLKNQNVTRLYFATQKVKQFSKRFDWNNIFTAILTNGGIGKGIAIGDTGKGIKKNDIYDI